MEKKEVEWHSTFGDICVTEPLFRENRKQIRPFCREAQVSHRSCSMPLERVLTDFGADHAFNKVNEKLQEHYGITLSTSVITRVTEKHASRILEQTKEPIPTLGHTATEMLILETDGCLIPIMTPDEESDDRRKNKSNRWKEARLILAHSQGSTSLKFASSYQQPVTQVGEQMRACAEMAGYQEGKTRVHAVGDGAKWIASQVDEQFGAYGEYLIDFYHLCEYVSAAASHCSDNPEQWIEEQKALLKKSQSHQVIQNLEPYLESSDIDDKQAPVRACYRYLTNRPGQFDYQSAIEHELPIGSGEIESAHRYVIQERLKLSGAWWRDHNAEAMIALRVCRENGEWNSYWDDYHDMAA